MTPAVAHPSPERKHHIRKITPKTTPKAMPPPWLDEFQISSLWLK
jgi:hypothetical protein